MIDAESLIRRDVRGLSAYQPILPFEVLSRRLGRAPEAIVKLDANENPYGPLAEVRLALAALPFAHIYPDPESTELREALATHTGLPVGNLLAGAGADELIDLVMLLFLEPGDAVVSCPPTFGMYAFDAGLHRARVVNVRRRADFSLDLDELERVVRAERPKLLCLASPNNPDGSQLPREALERVLALPVVVLLDEAYVEFAPPGTSRLTEVAQRSNLIVLRTFSKWAGLAGLRVGYGGFPSGLVPHLWKIKQPYNVSVAASTAAIVSLRHAEKLHAVGERLVAERARLFSGLAAVPFLSPYPSQSNFILCRVVGREARALKEGLAARGVLVRYFDTAGLTDHVRVSVGKPEHTDALLAALAALE
ncbi:MAG: histidinol-phosphate transaminase [Deltaproteobacteria bacterium]|nr:histidinol-phosphate transaminase [Deltaproteobacteria bacterium]